jgi:hypothetical protein
MTRFLAAVAMVAAGLLVPAAVAASPAPAARTLGCDKVQQLTLHLDHPAFSPNGDGRRDHVHATTYLFRTADVRLLLRGRFQDGRRRLLLDFGVRSADHVTHLRWDGRDAHGHLLPDGSYGARLVARAADGRTWCSDWVGLTIDTALQPGELQRDWPAVYPRTAGVRDVVTLRYVSPFDSIDWRTAQGRIVDPSGAVVKRLEPRSALQACEWQGTSLEVFVCGTLWTWAARSAGRPLPSGRYTVVVVGRDAAGNRQTSRLPVHVSRRHLVPGTETVTVPAAGSIYMPLYDPGCNGCGEDMDCGTVVAPGRFGDGSLSYRSADTCTDGRSPWASQSHVASYARVPAVGEHRVTAYGGPTTPGGPDQGVLVLDANNRVATGPDATDHETTSPWVLAALPGATSDQVVWSFRAEGTASYDVAWYRVETVVYRLPVS